MSCLDMTITHRGNALHDNDGPATDLAIFNIALFFHRAIHQNADDFTTVWAADINFLQTVHDVRFLFAVVPLL